MTVRIPHASYCGSWDFYEEPSSHFLFSETFSGQEFAEIQYAGGTASLTRGDQLHRVRVQATARLLKLQTRLCLIDPSEEESLSESVKTLAAEAEQYREMLRPLEARHIGRRPTFREYMERTAQLATAYDRDTQFLSRETFEALRDRSLIEAVEELESSP